MTAAAYWSTASSRPRRRPPSRRGFGRMSANSSTSTSPTRTGIICWACRLLLDAYPNAKPVALAESDQRHGGTQVSPGYMKVWSAYFPGQLPDTPVVPAPLSSTSIPIGDEVATVVPVGTTDSDLSTVVHVPALGLVVSGDVVYNQTHMWLRGSTPESRASWKRALDAVAQPRRGQDHRWPPASASSQTMMRNARSRRVANTSPTSKLRWLEAPPPSI